MQTKTISKSKTKTLFSPGHRACAGCGQAIAAKTVVEALGPNTIIANATGCLEVTTTPYPESAWGMPWIHSLFENPSAIASGILAALKQKNSLSRKGRAGEGIKVVAQGGDGSTFDIGFGLISGMWERGENILYVCYDNEAYMNTGIQASGSTPPSAHTTTTPAGSASLGSTQMKKNMIDIALAHKLPYVAQTTTGFLADIKTKIQKAVEIEGPAYVQILSPCIPGWKIKPDVAIKIGKIASQTGIYPVMEYENGKLTSSIKTPSPRPKVDEYLKMQGRFKHLFKSKQGLEKIKEIQRLADENVEKYG
ncbi:MAG: thiamine pyrophosphate-dependent enzyme [Candidatus Falkowbacteria bacterium]